MLICNIKSINQHDYYYYYYYDLFILGFCQNNGTFAQEEQKASTFEQLR